MSWQDALGLVILWYDVTGCPESWLPRSYVGCILLPLFITPYFYVFCLLYLWSYECPLLRCPTVTQPTRPLCNHHRNPMTHPPSTLELVVSLPKMTHSPLWISSYLDSALYRVDPCDLELTWPACVSYPTWQQLTWPATCNDPLPLLEQNISQCQIEQLAWPDQTWPDPTWPDLTRPGHPQSSQLDSLSDGAVGRHDEVRSLMRELFGSLETELNSFLAQHERTNSLWVDHTNSTTANGTELFDIYQLFLASYLLVVPSHVPCIIVMKYYRDFLHKRSLVSELLICITTDYSITIEKSVL